MAATCSEVWEPDGYACELIPSAAAALSRATAPRLRNLAGEAAAAPLHHPVGRRLVAGRVVEPREKPPEKGF